MEHSRLHRITRRSLPMAALLTIAFSSSSAAQIPEAPKELGRLDKLLGNWEGKGTMLTAPDAEPAPWTGRVTVKKVLRDFAIQEDWGDRRRCSGSDLVPHAVHVRHSVRELSGGDVFQPRLRRRLSNQPHGGRVHRDESVSRGERRHHERPRDLDR